MELTDLHIEEFVSSKPSMIREAPRNNTIKNNTAHDMLVKRQCFIGRLLTELSQLEVPTQYKVFNAYSVIGALCGPHSFIRAQGDYPLNLWTLLIGPSSGRKSSSMIPYQNVFSRSEYLKKFILPEDMTIASLREPLEQSYEIACANFDEKKAVANGIFFVQEFNDFLDVKANPKATSALVRLWGDQPLVKISRKTSGDFEFKNPTISILGAIQPRRVMDVLPLETWKQGFFPRLIPVYSDITWPEIEVDELEMEEGDIFDQQNKQVSYKDLLLGYEQDFKDLAQSSFVVGFDKESRELYNTLKLPSLPNQLVDYEGRREEHLRKLAAITAISRAYNNTIARNKIIKITKEDFLIAYNLLYFNDSQLRAFVKDAVRGSHFDIFERIDDMLNENDGQLTQKQIREFCMSETHINHIRLLERSIKEVYLTYNSATKTYIKNKDIE